jgi:glycerol-3-phosphate O-acyltransferase/dihydroxyacetone phosphate acyltransferase
VDVLNMNSLPRSGPVIIYGNHANQFVDAMNLIAKCPRSISFLIAMKSWKRRVIGDAAKMLGAVPVLRPQDIAFKGEGKIVRLEVDEEKEQYWAIGEGTKFTQIDLKKGAKLRAIGGWKGDLVCAEDPISDTKIEMKKFPSATEDAPAPVCTSPVDFKVLPKIDQKKVFGEVNRRLANNGTIGMFPEGGSHDQGHLLPLKAGITIMALGSAAEGTPVLLTPVGLVYFHAHRFRSKAVVQYGEPFPPPPGSWRCTGRGRRGRRAGSCWRS